MRDARDLEFVSRDPVGLERLREALEPGVRLAASPEHAVTHQWLDTFDRRLRRAGLSLELATEADPGQPTLLLEDRGALSTWSAPARPGDRGAGRRAWRLEELVGAGPMLRRLAPAVGIRALLPVAEVSTRTLEVRVLDAHDKTTVRLVVEERVGPVAPDELPRVRVVVGPLTGYRRHSDRLVARLRRLAELEPFSGGWPALLPSLAKTPAEAPAGPTLTPGLESAQVVRQILARLLAAAVANAPGVVADWDTEFLHDLRVSVRRARSALKLLGDCLDSREASPLAADLKWMGDLTTPTRDLDVHLLAVSAGGEWHLDPLLAAPLVPYLQARRAAARRQLVRGLRSARWNRAQRRWEEIARPRPPAGGGPGAVPIGELAGTRIALAYRRARRAGIHIEDDSPPEMLHTLRKRCKELRYLLEFFAPLLEGPPFLGLLSQLRALQDCLGEFQDTQVQAATLRELAAEMLADPTAGAEAVMGLGTVDQALAERRRRARAEFASRFHDFARPRTRRAVAALQPGGRPAPMPT